MLWQNSIYFPSSTSHHLPPIIYLPLFHTSPPSLSHITSLSFTHHLPLFHTSPPSLSHITSLSFTHHLPLLSHITSLFFSHITSLSFSRHESSDQPAAQTFLLRPHARYARDFRLTRSLSVPCTPFYLCHLPLSISLFDGIRSCSSAR